MANAAFFREAFVVTKRRLLHTRNMARVYWTALLAASFVACGGEVSTQTDSAQPGDPAHKSWRDMSFVERKGYMANVVLPQMQSLFEAYDSERYADFSCQTCHSPDPGAHSFEMPSSHLRALYPTDSPEQKTMVEEQREMVTFMYQQVVPTMTRLLDAEPWSDETKTGFGCFNCHTLAQSGAAAQKEVSGGPDSIAP